MAFILRRVAALPLVFALVACGPPDRSPSGRVLSGQSSVGYAGPQALVLRIPHQGGPPRAYGYPRTDSVVWTGDPAPTPDEVLAFDDESGSVAYRDRQGRPVLLELRLGTITIVDSLQKLTGLSAANGDAIFGIAPDGQVVRMTPSGDWTYKPPEPARAIFPQPDGALLMSIGTGARTRLVRLFPPDRRLQDDIPFPVATRTIRTELGDRLYLAVDSGLAVFRTRTMDWGKTIPLSEPILTMATSPSGDRVFALMNSRREIVVIDRFREEVSAQVPLPAPARDLRVDPFGRYLLARAETGDSIWIIAVGTVRVLGAVRGDWRADLPFVSYDGFLAVANGNDVVFIDGETLKARNRVRGGANDFWYPFLWDGFRPRSALLDEPVTFDSLAVDSAVADSMAPDSTRSVADTVAPKGFIVSFAAFLAEDRARELASRIHVGGENARVVIATRDGATIYRVILGPYLTREEADRAGRESRQSYWVFEGEP